MLSSLADWVQSMIAAHGLSAVFVLMVLESACVPVPSEVTMIYAGYLVSQGTFGFVAAVLVGSFGNLVGSWIAWAAGAYGVDAVLVRGDHARGELARTQRWFDRYGGRLVFFGRMVPLVRTFVSLPAGVARMPLGRFSVLTFLGCLPWCIGLVAIGNYAGSNWQQWEHRLGYLNYLIVAAIAALAGLWLLRRRRRVAV
jgi:membrane protein DedA with SNARE-associated domain